MTKKIFIHIAALSVIAACALGCDAATNDSNGKTDNDITAPVVELPPSVGENPFKGKTFETGGRYKENYRKRYIFSSDGKTITVKDSWDNEEFVPYAQYRCSVDANKKEVAWYPEKKRYGSGQLYSFEEYATYIKSGKFWEDYKADVLNGGYITADEFDELSKDYKEAIDKEIADGFPSTKNNFSAINRYKYEYNEDEETLDLYEQFEKSSARLDYWGQSPNGLHFNISVESQSMTAAFHKDNDDRSTLFSSQSFSDNEIVLVNPDNKSDTFTAKYEWLGSDNDTKMKLSFTYNGEKFNPTLDFRPQEIHLTEVK